MAQKPLFRAGVAKPQKKNKAANRHGKTPTTRRGRLYRPPKKPTLVASAATERALTQAINARNEAAAAAKAAGSGGRLRMVAAAAATGDKQEKAEE